MLKLVNPFYYPLGVLVGAIVLVAGVRWLRIPNLIIIPSSVAVTLAGASVLKQWEDSQANLEEKQLKQDLKTIKLMAEDLANKAEVLRQESQSLLSHNDFQLDLLVLVQQACDRSLEIPQKIEQITNNISQSKSLLSLNELQGKLTEVKQKLNASTGVSRDYLEELVLSLEKNIALAQTGRDIRQAQIINLQKLIEESAGYLQQLQNKLRNTDLNSVQNIEKIRDLTDELDLTQDNFNMLVS